MSTTLSMWFGIAFVALAIGAAILQAWLWSFPMVPDPGGPDPNGKSTAPRLWTNVHRLMGLAYLVIYVVMMSTMLPRLWEYQFELPARTIAHACMGILIGVLLVTKIAIIRWFQHFGKSLPAIGLSLVACTLILATLSLPYAIQAHGLTQDLTSAENVARLSRVLAQVDGLGAEVTELVKESSIREGREVLTHKCSVCHDMRTVLMKPRSAASWHSLVERMAEKPNLGPPITFEDIPKVTTYLVAISPDLQNSVQKKRQEERDRAVVAEKLAEKPADVVPAMAVAPAPVETPYDAAASKKLFETKCSECHELADVEEHGGDSTEGWTKIVKKMIEEEEAEVSDDDAKLIIRFLSETWPKKV